MTAGPDDDRAPPLPRYNLEVILRSAGRASQDAPQVERWFFALNRMSDGLLVTGAIDLAFGTRLTLPPGG